MATGLARGAAARRKKIAFGDGTKIIWDKNSEVMFAGNPNIAPPNGTNINVPFELEWIPFYKGNRLYNRHLPGRWEWNYEFRCIPGEVFLTEQEKRFARLAGKEPYIVMEPNPSAKSPVANKRWPFDRYEAVAKKLWDEGFTVVQLNYPGARMLKTAHTIPCPSFRHGMAILAGARLYIGGEGGMHHAAAAVGVGGVVLFGGFVPPQVTGYAIHANLTGLEPGAEACGSFNPCEHCRIAMDRIAVEEVVEHAMARL
jgi:hypothetical protein